MTVGRSGWSVLKPNRLDLLTVRGTINGASMLAWFYAVPLLPLNDLTALGFTAPLWATVLAVLLLGEVVGWRRWAATLIGFVGVVVILQPGFSDVHWASGLVLFSSAMWAFTIIVVPPPDLFGATGNDPALSSADDVNYCAYPLSVRLDDAKRRGVDLAVVARYIRRRSTRIPRPRLYHAGR